MTEYESVTSSQNNRIKRAAKLRERRGRRQQQRTIVDGLRETGQAVASSWPIDELFCRRSSFNSAEVQSIGDAARHHVAEEPGEGALLPRDVVVAHEAATQAIESVTGKVIKK